METEWPIHEAQTSMFDTDPTGRPAGGETRSTTVRAHERRLPYQRHSETSRAAAQAARPNARTAREAVMDCIRDHGPLADREIQNLLGLEGSSERPRRIELAAAGRIEKAGVKIIDGRSHTTWQERTDE